jgi:hypothetical protein
MCHFDYHPCPAGLVVLLAMLEGGFTERVSQRWMSFLYSNAEISDLLPSFVMGGSPNNDFLQILVS